MSNGEKLQIAFMLLVGLIIICGIAAGGGMF
jgi:hypothetical protein